MSKSRVLIIDDEEYMRKLIKRSLVHENYTIEEANSAESALVILNRKNFDLIILDLSLGDIDGFDLLEEIKKIDENVPVIIVSGRTEDHHQVLGLGLGAINYITKPFSPAVLCAHVKAQLKANHSLDKNESNIIINGPFKFDITSYKLYKDDQFINLSSKENLLIKFLLTNPEKVFTKKQLYENVWDDFIYDDNTIMVYIHQLRKKIESDPKSPKHIVTVWGIGYKFLP